MDTGGGPIRVQLAHQSGDAPVEIIVFFRFAHPNAPKNDGRVVPVLKNHLLGVLQLLIFPLDIADVAGARNLADDQEAKFIAAVQEGRRLGVVCRPNGVYAQLVLQNIRILNLHGIRHGVTHVREGLGSAEPPKLDFLSVQIEPVLPEFRFSESHPGNHGVHDFPFCQQFRPEIVQNRVIRFPAPDASHGESHGSFRGGYVAHIRIVVVGSVQANTLANLHRRFRIGNLYPTDGLRPAAWEMGAHIHVLNVHLFFDIQVHVPIDAAVGQEIRMLSEWRNVQAFPGV